MSQLRVHPTASVALRFGVSGQGSTKSKGRKEPGGPSGLSLLELPKGLSLESLPVRAPAQAEYSYAEDRELPKKVAILIES